MQRLPRNTAARLALDEARRAVKMPPRSQESRRQENLDKNLGERCTKASSCDDMGEGGRRHLSVLKTETLGGRW